MVELQADFQRGAFHLQIECSFQQPLTVVFGPSGSGKSTLLRLIAGLDHPQSGRIAIHGRYVTDTQIGLHLRPGPRPDQRQTSLVPQQSALFPHISVEANVAYSLIGMDSSSVRNRCASMLELVGAAHLANRSPRALSGGEAQRISLARALACEPKLLLLDEPLSALDAGSRDALLERVGPWLDEHQIQTILVTHDIADAMATEAEVVQLQDGHLLAQGPAATVLATERQRLLARLG